MNPLDSAEIDIAITNNFVISLTSEDWYNQHKTKLKKVQLCLKIDVGMNRFGFNDIEIINELINNNDNIEGLYTHFPVADLDDLTMHNDQVELFVNIYNKIDKKNQLKFIHAENSATALYKDTRLSFCNYIRIGLLGYGTTPLKRIPNLKPTFYVTAPIVSIKKVLNDGFTGYGISAPVKKDSYLAILPIGYGDGLSKLRVSIPVYINKQKYNVLSITMSHTIIEVDSSITLDDIVEIYGDNILLDDMYLKTNIPSAIQMTSLHTNMK